MTGWERIRLLPGYVSSALGPPSGAGGGGTFIRSHYKPHTDRHCRPNTLPSKLTHIPFGGYQILHNNRAIYYYKPGVLIIFVQGFTETLTQTLNNVNSPARKADLSVSDQHWISRILFWTGAEKEENLVCLTMV